MLSNMKISSRLILLLVFLLINMVLIGVVGLYAASKSNSAMKSVNNDRVVPIMQLNVILKANLSSRLAITNAIVQPENMAEHIKKLTENQALVDQQWKEFFAIVLSDLLVDEEDKTLAKHFTEAYTEFVEQGIKPAVTAMHANDVASLKKTQVEQITPLNVKLDDALKALLEMQMRDSQKAAAESDATFRSMRTFSIVLAMLGVALGSALGFFIIRHINRTIAALRDVMVNMSSDGNLNVRAAVNGQEEIGQASAAFNGLIESFSGIMREIEDCGRNMGQSSYQVSTISNEISEVSKQQESHSGEVISAMRQLHQVSSSVQSQAIEAADRSRQVETLAHEGIGSVHQNIGFMEETAKQVGRASVEIQELEQSAQKIHNIVKTIKEIAGQTNLLALNAAIEAARAGEQGRGFAVVADEVRKLAERTTHSASEVSEIIGKLSGKVQQVAITMSGVVEKVNFTQEEAGKTANTIEKMASNAVETAQVSQGMSSASRQQLEQFGLLQSTLEMLFSILKESGAKVDITAAIGSDLRVVAGRLNDIMSGFTFANGMKITAAQHEKRRVPRAQHSLLVRVQQGDQTIEAVTSDFSMTGMKLRLSQPMNEAEPLNLAIYLPNEDMEKYEEQEALRVKAKILWQRLENDARVCGVEFVNLDDAKRNAIKECFVFFNKNSEFQN